MSWSDFTLARRRDKAARAARGPLADYYRVPVPASSTPAEDLRLLAIDIETTGLDPKNDHVLSAGFVPVEGTIIVLGGARNLVIAGASVGQSATIHRLTDDIVAAGLPKVEALTLTLEALAGRVLLAHHAPIEVGFLSRACLEHFGAPLVVPVIDTMLLQHRLLTPGFNDEPRVNELRLWAARSHFHLPRYGAHQALTDALACAELYLAQLTEITGRLTLKTLAY